MGRIVCSGVTSKLISPMSITKTLTESNTLVYTIYMRQRYDNVARFVTTEYAEPFVELILKYPNVTVLENLATEQITLKARETDSTLLAV